MPPKPPRGVRPGTNYYWNGQEWVWINRAARSTVKPPPGRGGGGGSKPFNVDKWAQEQAQRYIDSQIAAIEEQRKVYLDELDKRSKLEAERGLALAQALQGMNFGGKIQNIYSQGATDIAGLAQGFSGEMQGVASGQAAEMANMLSGTGQEGAVRNEGVGMGDVLYGTQGYIPGRSMTETGAAMGAQAALEPSFAARIGQLEASRVFNEGQEGLTPFTEALIEARSGKAGLVQDFKDKRMAAQNDAWERRFQMLKWQADQHYRNYMLALDRGDQRLAQKEYQLAVQKQRQAEREANRQYGLDVRQQDWRESPNNPDNKPDAQKPKWTPTQARDSMKDVVASAEGVANAVNEAIRTRQWTPSAGNKKQRRALINRIFQAYSYLAITPAARQRLKQIIMKAVAAAERRGPPAPGTEGPTSGSTGSTGSYEDYR